MILLVKILEGLVDKLRPIVKGNGHEAHKAMIYVFVDEWDEFLGLYLGEWFSLNPFCEVVYCYRDEPSLAQSGGNGLIIFMTHMQKGDGLKISLSSLDGTKF